MSRLQRSSTPTNFYDYLIEKGFSESEVIEWRGIHPGIYYNLPPIEKLPRLSFPLGNGIEDVMYGPTRVQRLFHGSQAENCILEGPRGTGKSTAIRMDAHMCAMSMPGFKYLVLRRKLTDLKKNHLLFIDGEMKKFVIDGKPGKFNKTDNIAYYPNGSVGFYSYCVTLKDIENLLSSEWDRIYFDEITTFPWEWVTKIAASLRVPEGEDAGGVLRGGTNPLGVGAAKIRQYFITKKVSIEEDAEYRPENYEAIKTLPEDNPYVNWEKYRRRLGSLTGNTKKAWLDGEWIIEGACFSEFKLTHEGRPWHVIDELPTIRGQSILFQSWLRIYRSLDWGFRPDPAVCHWHMVLPNGHTITFKTRRWTETVAKKVAEAIIRESDGMKVVATFADPSIFAKKGEDRFSVGEIFENNHVPLTPSINDRTVFVDAIADYLNTILQETAEIEGGEKRVVSEYPKLQILSDKCSDHRLGCPDLIRTFPDMMSDPNNARRLADDQEDHYVVAEAYFCIGDTPPSRDPERPEKPRWMLPKRAFNKSFPARI